MSPGRKTQEEGRRAWGEKPFDGNTDSMEFLIGSIDKAHRSRQCQQETNIPCTPESNKRIVNKPASTVSSHLSGPNQLSIEDELILHGLGVTWIADETRAKLRRLK